MWMVIEVQEARLSASSSLGEGPASLPPFSAGSSTVSEWCRALS